MTTPIVITQAAPTLSTFADGAVDEAFTIEMQKILLNIADMNTDPHAKREINIKVVLAPIGEEREEVRIFVQCSGKTISHKPIETLLWLTPAIGEDGGVSINYQEVKKRSTTLQDYGYQD